MAESADASVSETSHTKPQDKSEYIKVVVRCRPPNQREIDGGHESMVEIDTKQGLVELKTLEAEETQAKKSFTFERVYDRFSKQSDLYDETFRDVIDGVLQGYNGTIFVYGQTGAGKTFTMQGVKDHMYPELQGVIPRSAEHIFHHIAKSQDQQYLVRCSSVQIYQEEIYDLLKEKTPTPVQLKESPDTGVYIKDVSTFIVTSMEDVERVLKKGVTTTCVWATNMGVYSTRVTYIFTITVEHNEIGEDGRKHTLVGRLNLVDMAGSERPPKSATTGAVQREYKRNWQTVQSFRNVITALDTINRGGSSMIPYRDSKVTRLLQDSLDGTAKTVMVACIGPASCNYDETLCTLRCAERAKNVKNRPKVNIDPKVCLLQEHLEEIERLKAQLADMTIGKQKSDQQEEGQEKDESNQDNDSYKDDVEEPWKEQINLEVNKVYVCSDQNLSLQEKNRKLSENKGKIDDVFEKETEARDTLISNIQKLEARLLTGRDSTARDT